MSEKWRTVPRTGSPFPLTPAPPRRTIAPLPQPAPSSAPATACPLGHRDRDSPEAYNIPAMEPRIQYAQTTDEVSITWPRLSLPSI